mmetsp:Transcript_21533/g.42979  ORF Transcript_21533/g.42979 Transcript_21533/m.42979 type:complete len:518 (+) Transcript_21533:909-2462(+)
MDDVQDVTKTDDVMTLCQVYVLQHRLTKHAVGAWHRVPGRLDGRGGEDGIVEILEVGRQGLCVLVFGLGLQNEPICFDLEGVEFLVKLCKQGLSFFHGRALPTDRLLADGVALLEAPHGREEGGLTRLRLRGLPGNQPAEYAATAVRGRGWSGRQRPGSDHGLELGLLLGQGRLGFGQLNLSFRKPRAHLPPPLDSVGLPGLSVPPLDADLSRAFTRILQRPYGEAPDAVESVKGGRLRLLLCDAETAAVVPLLAAVAAEHEAVEGPPANTVHVRPRPQHTRLLGHVYAEALKLEGQGLDVDLGLGLLVSEVCLPDLVGPLLGQGHMRLEVLDVRDVRKELFAPHHDLVASLHGDLAHDRAVGSNDGLGSLHPPLGLLYLPPDLPTYLQLAGVPNALLSQPLELRERLGGLDCLLRCGGRDFRARSALGGLVQLRATVAVSALFGLVDLEVGLHVAAVLLERVLSRLENLDAVANLPRPVQPGLELLRHRVVRRRGAELQNTVRLLDQAPELWDLHA